MMKLLQCVVYLGSEKYHSVVKSKITELELQLLRHIHTNDAITGLRQVGEIDVVKNDEYRNLARFYGVDAVEKCFDIKLDGFSDWLEATLQDEEAKRYETTIYDTYTFDDAPSELVTDELPEEFAFDGEGNPVVATAQEATAEEQAVVEVKQTVKTTTKKTAAKAVVGLE